MFEPIPGRASIVLWLILLTVSAGSAAIDIQTPTIHAFNWNSFFVATAIVLVFSFVAMVVSLVITRDVDRSVRYGTAVTIVVFWWTVFTQIALSVGVEALVGSVTLAVAAVFAVGIGKFGRARVGVALFALAIGGIAAANVSQALSGSVEVQERGSVVSALNPPSVLPNVFVLLLDGHARQDTLESLYSSTDRSFVRALAQSGFKVNESAVSNYSGTYASVSSMLSLDGLVSDDVQMEDSLSVLRSVNGGDGEFLYSFREAGYSVTFVPAPWGGSFCGSVVDRCVRIGEAESSLFWLLESSLLAPLTQGRLQHPWTSISQEQLGSISRIFEVDLRDARPTITWMHVIQPHPPVTLTKACQVSAESWRRELDLTKDDQDDEKRKAAYVDQTACVDSTVVEQMQAVVQSDPNAVILVVSDHGPDGQLQTITPIQEFTSDQITEKLSVLAAFRGPKRCSSVATIDSVVMAMRELTRCLLNAEVSSEPIDSYLLPQEGAAKMGEMAVLVPRPAQRTTGG